MRFHPQPIPLDPQTKWEASLTKPLRERGNYVRTDQEITYQQIAGVFLGTFEDREAFEEYLYLLAHEASNRLECLFQGLNREIDNQRFQDIQRIINIHSKDNLSINRFIAFMEGSNLLPFRSEPFYPFYRETFKSILLLFEKAYGSLAVPEFRRLIVDLVKWSWNYMDVWGKTYHFEERMPRILWYGNAKMSEAYFLYFLTLFGCDVVAFHPEGQNIFSVIPDSNIQEVKYPVNTTLFDFPQNKPDRRSTVAKKASEQMNEILHDESSMLYHPWQFRDYTPMAITLKTTYDELFILQPEKAFLRPGFKARHPIIEIPTLFAKVVGLTQNRNEYWSRIQKISSFKLSKTFNAFPIATRYKGNMQFHYREVLNGDKISPEKLVNASFWPYKHLATPLQFGLAGAISRLIDEAKIERNPTESIDEKRWYLLGQALMIPDSLIQLFQQFDYSQDVPTVVVFNNGKSGEFSREDAVLLSLLNEIGFDVLLYNPTGQNDLENFLEPKHYDIHWLDEMSFDESFTAVSNVIHRTSRLKTFFERLF